jgi:hypothetical protein
MQDRLLGRTGLHFDDKSYILLRCWCIHRFSQTFLSCDIIFDLPAHAIRGLTPTTLLTLLGELSQSLRLVFHFQCHHPGTLTEVYLTFRTNFGLPLFTFSARNTLRLKRRGYGLLCCLLHCLLHCLFTVYSLSIHCLFACWRARQQSARPRK